jgi:hypothetical protein
MPTRKQTKYTHALMHNKSELLKGDETSISIIYNNLTGQNPVGPGYIEMMNREFGITVEPSKLWINRLTACTQSS